MPVFHWCSFAYSWNWMWEPELELRNPPVFARTCCRKVMWVDLWQLLCVRDIVIIISITNDPLLQVWFKGLGQKGTSPHHWCEENWNTSYITQTKLQCSGSLYQKRSISAFAFLWCRYGFPSWHFLYEIMCE